MNLNQSVESIKRYIPKTFKDKMVLESEMDKILTLQGFVKEKELVGFLFDSAQICLGVNLKEEWKKEIFMIISEVSSEDQ